VRKVLARKRARPVIERRSGGYLSTLPTSRHLRLITVVALLFSITRTLPRSRIKSPIHVGPWHSGRGTRGTSIATIRFEDDGFFRAVYRTRLNPMRKADI